MARFDFNPTHDNPSTDLYVFTIMTRAECLKHGASTGKPCYDYPAVEGDGRYTGICNTRAKKGGMTGRISPTSLDRSLSKSNRG